MSLATSGTALSLDQAKMCFIYQNISWVPQLNLKDGDYIRAKDLDCDRYQFLALVKTEALRKAESSSSEPAVWQVPEGWEDAVQQALERSTLLPCGHRPFKNPRGLDGYTCQQECGRVYAREEIEEVRR